MTPKQKRLAEKKEMKARKKRTLAALDRLTKSPEPLTDSEDLSEAEESVTAAILASLPKKKKEDNAAPRPPPTQNGRKTGYVAKRTTCPYCQEVFNCAGTFFLHRKIKHFWGKFKCSKCLQESQTTIVTQCL